MKTELESALMVIDCKNDLCFAKVIHVHEMWLKGVILNSLRGSTNLCCLIGLNDHDAGTNLSKPIRTSYNSWDIHTITVLISDRSEEKKISRRGKKVNDASTPSDPHDRINGQIDQRLSDFHKQWQVIIWQKWIWCDLYVISSTGSEWLWVINFCV